MFGKFNSPTLINVSKLTDELSKVECLLDSLYVFLY